MNENIVKFTNCLGERSVDSLFLDAVTEKEVEIEISTLNSNKSCGHDEIPSKIVEEISKNILKVYNQSLITGV